MPPGDLSAAAAAVLLPFEIKSDFVFFLLYHLKSTLQKKQVVIATYKKENNNDDDNIDSDNHDHVAFHRGRCRFWARMWIHISLNLSLYVNIYDLSKLTHRNKTAGTVGGPNDHRRGAQEAFVVAGGHKVGEDDSEGEDELDAEPFPGSQCGAVRDGGLQVALVSWHGDTGMGERAKEMEC